MSDGEAATARIALDSGWTFRRLGDAEWLPAQVPGSNFTDLLRSDLIPDPMDRDNEPRLQWIERDDWEYRCSFEVAAVDLDADRIDLVFDGLDTFCEAALNGAPILSADNMFRTWRIDCGSQLREGSNELSLTFRSPVRMGEERAQGDDFQYPAENDKTEGRISPYVRKAPYHFGWDWGPKFAVSGVWRPVRLEAIRGGRIADVAHRIMSLDEQRAELEFTVEADAPADEPLTVEVAGVAAPVEGGRATVRVTIDQPRLWWPNGLGDPHLYHFDVLLTRDGATADRLERAIGLRTVEVVNEPDADGESFYLKVNGRPVFMKGANYIPPDSFLERVGPERTEQLFRDCVDANFNMLRVWGGGAYESDLFYDLADRHGILIWQDFMFACALYPSDDAFLESVRAEAEDQVRRLRHHPAIALWCGNNEVGLGIAYWEWPEKFGYSERRYAAMIAGYRALFDDLLPAVVAAQDPERFYFASSPIGHWNDSAQDGKGDGHYWGVWHGELPFRTYEERLSRFMSEYGFQSYPLLPSVERFTGPADRHVGSPVLGGHQKHGRGDAIIGRFIAEELGEPTDFEQFCYLSQVVQADGLKVAFEAHRRNAPLCMGSLYWQINDCWPAISWSSIDYYGRWKALHHQAARSFAPVILSVETRDAALAIHGVSDRTVPLTGTLTAELIDFAGTPLADWSFAVALDEASAAVIARIAADDIRAAGDPADSVLRLRLSGDDDELIAEATHLFAPSSALAPPDPGLAIEIDGDRQVRVRAARFARAVHVFAKVAGDAERALNFSDNFFDLVPGEERILTTRDDLTIDPASLAVVSLHDMRRVVEPAAGKDRRGQRHAAG